jgi:predicted DCC family thiol-disulfide oxidoreductase YuxK
MIVLWDRDCGFCAWALALLLRADRHAVLRPAPIESPEGDRHLAGMPPERRTASWHVVDADGRVTSGGRALTEVLRVLPAGRPLAAVTGALPGVTEAAYRWVATHRSLLSKPIPAAAKERARRRIEAHAAPGR